MSVVPPELKSFVTKFADLWHSGRNASLSLECEAGEATINLKLRLGSHSFQHHHQGEEHCLERRAGPSRLRRRARRAQARAMAADQAGAAAAEKASDLPSEGAKTAEEAASSPAAKVDAAVQAEIVPKPAAQAGHVDAAVQVVCPEHGQILFPLYGMQAASLPPTHLPLPVRVPAIANSSEWSCKCCQYEKFFRTEEALENHHDTAHDFIEYRECNICYNGHVWT